MLLPSTQWVTKQAGKSKIRTSWTAKIFQWLCNLTLKSSCHLTGPRSLHSHLPSISSRSSLRKLCALLTISSFFVLSLAPHHCRWNSQWQIITPMPPKSIPFPKIIVWVRCDTVPRLWFPDHIMISLPWRCLPTAKSGWIKGVYFCFAHNAQKGYNVSRKGSRLIYFNS